MTRIKRRKDRGDWMQYVIGICVLAIVAWMIAKVAGWKIGWLYGV